MVSTQTRVSRRPRTCLEGVTREVLPNGVTLLLRPSSFSRAVAVVAWFRVGYFDETDDESGLAHLMEHMFFKGTPSHPHPEAIGQTIEGLGGSLNAGTIYDRTSYYFVVPARALPPALALMTEAISSPLLDPTELSRELEVVLEESRRKRDNPSALSSELLLEHAFQVHPIQRWRIGRDDVLRGLTREQVLAFHQRTYRPNRLVVSVVGDFHVPEALALCRSQLGTLQGPPSPERVPELEPEQHGLRVGLHWGDQPLEHFHLAFKIPGPGLDSKALAGLGILACILGQGRTSRLYRALKTELGLVRSVSASAWGFGQVGLFQVSAVLEPGQRDSVRARLLLELERLREHGVTAQELKTAQIQLEVGRLSQLEEVRGQAMLLAWQESNGGLEQAQALQTYTAQLLPGHLQGLARQYLVPETATLLELLPSQAKGELGADQAVSPASPLSSAVLPSAPSLTTPPHGEPFVGSAEVPGLRITQLASYLEEWEAAKRAAKARVRTDMPPRRPRTRRLPPARKRGGLYELKLPGDVPLAVQEEAGLPLAVVTVLFSGGASRDPSAEMGRTRLTLRSALSGGIGELSPEGFFSLQSMLGISIERLVYEDHVGYRLHVPSSELGKALDLLECVLLEARFQPDRVERERESLLLELKQVTENPQRHASQLLFEARYGDEHPFGLGLASRAEALRTLTRSTLMAHYARLCSGGRAVCAAAGDIRTEGLAARLTALLARLPGAPLTDVLPPPVLLQHVREKVDCRPRHQTALTFGFDAPVVTSADYPALQVMLTVLSSFSGRLQATLRGRESLAYSVGAHDLGSASDNLVLCTLACEPRKEGQARAGILREVSRLAQEGVQSDELQRTKSLLRGRLEIGAQTLVSRSSRLIRQLQLGRPAFELEAYWHRLDLVTAEDIQRVAQRVFTPDRYVLGVARAGRG